MINTVYNFIEIVSTVLKWLTSLFWNLFVNNITRSKNGVKIWEIAFQGVDRCLQFLVHWKRLLLFYTHYLQNLRYQCQSLLNKINDISFKLNADDWYTFVQEVDRAMCPFQMALSLVWQQVWPRKSMNVFSSATQKRLVSPNWVSSLTNNWWDWLRFFM